MAMLTITKKRLAETLKLAEPCITILMQCLPHFEKKLEEEAKHGRTAATATISDIKDEESAHFICDYIFAEFKEAGFDDDDFTVSYEKGSAKDYIVELHVNWNPND